MIKKSGYQFIGTKGRKTSHGGASHQNYGNEEVWL